VTVEPGVTNLEITRQVAPFGFYYAPDPSSQQVCSIGGTSLKIPAARTA
jgi:glycolate oxidase